MDISLNMIDLQYLTNPLEMIKVRRDKGQPSVDLVNDIAFYRRRIFQQTKDYLRGNKVNPKLNMAFENYARICVEHFKFIDKSEIIQRDYKQLKGSTSSTTVDFNIDDSNELIMKTKAPRVPKITDHIKVKAKTGKTARKVVLPKTRNFNLKDSRFRTKGTKS